jgi:hypothetical protein
MKVLLLSIAVAAALSVAGHSDATPAFQTERAAATR